MKNYFQATPSNPFHLSVGAIVYTDDLKIMLHHFKEIGRLENVYMPMKETLEPKESIEECLHRGLMEEFGATIFPDIQFLGSYVINDLWFGEINKECMVEKTILYFLVKLKESNSAKREKDSLEGGSEIVYEDIDFLIRETKNASEKYSVKELDASWILEKAKAVLEGSSRY